MSDRHSDTTRNGSIGEPFDPTNGLAGDLDGDSDGTAASDTSSEADRGSETTAMVDEDGDTI